MNKDLSIKKQKYMAIVIMLLIIMMVLLLMMVEFDIELNNTINTSETTNNIDTDESSLTNNPLTVISMPSDMDITITEDNLSPVFNDEEYIETSSKEYTTNIAITSSVGSNYTTSCNYSIYITDVNSTITNEYIKDDNTLGILNNQLLLKVENTFDKEVFYLDLVNSKSNVINKTITHSLADNTKAGEDKWVMSLVFRNYKEYNQTNNAGKSIKAKVNVTFNECTVEKR